MRITSKERWYDYASKEEFNNHYKEMEQRGWCLIKNCLIEGDEKYKYTACYKTGLLYNGVNGR